MRCFLIRMLAALICWGLSSALVVASTVVIPLHSNCAQGAQLTGPSIIQGVRTYTVACAAPVPSGCTVSASPGGAVAPGTMVTLTVACTGGGTPTAWQWTAVPTAAGMQGASTATVRASVQATTVFTAQVCAPTQGLSASNCATVNHTVTVSGTPACSLAANPTSAQGGQNVVLTATCAPAATRFAWSGPGTIACASGANTCTVVFPNSQSGPVTYGVVGGNTAGNGPTASVQVTPVVSGPTPPSGCSISGLPAGPVSSNSTLNLGVSCTGGGAVSYHEWSTSPTPVSAQGANSRNYTVKLASPSTITVKVCSTPAPATGSCTQVAATVQVTVPPTGPTCQLMATPTSARGGEAVTLNATCSPAASSYTWSGPGTVACPSASGRCTVSFPSGQTAAVTYGVQGRNSGGPGNVATVQVQPLGPGGPPVCSLTARPLTVAPAGGITLSADCQPPATSLSWFGPGVSACSSTTTTCALAAPSAVGGATFGVQGSNSVGVGGRANVTVQVQAPAPPAPSNCTITGPTGTVNAGASVTLGVGCAGGGTAVYWRWSASPNPTSFQGAQTAQVTMVVQQTTNVTAQVCSSLAPQEGACTNVTRAVSVNGPPGGGVFAGTCPGYQQTLIIPGAGRATVMDESLYGVQSYRTSQYGGFGGSSILVLPFYTPSNGGSTAWVMASVAQAEGPVATRLASVSREPCKIGSGEITFAQGTTNTQYLSVGVANPRLEGAPVLTPGTLYYFNVVNRTAWGLSTCSGDCQALLYLNSYPAMRAQ